MKSKFHSRLTMVIVFALGVFAVWGIPQSMLAASGTKGPQTFVVTTTDDAGPGSLRQAIEQANAHPGRDWITFDIRSMPNVEGMHVIVVQSLLPAITDAVVVDGTSQPGYSPENGPVVEVNGGELDKACAGVESGIYRDHPGLDVARVDASGTTIKGLQIRSFCEGIAVTANVSGPQSGCPGNADARITGVTIRDNVLADNPGGNAALDLCNVAHSRLQRNSFDHNGDHIEVTRSEYVVIAENEGRDAQDAIELIGGDHVTIADNRFSDNRRSGIALVFGTHSNRIVGNEISNMATSGIILSDNNVAVGNKITHVGWFGIEVRHGSGNTVRGNTVTHSGVAGIVVSAAMFNGLVGCSEDAEGNPVDCVSGFNLGKGDALNNVINGNVVTFNNGPGILVGGTYVEPDGTVRMAARNRLLGNTIYGNAGLGIDLSDEIQSLYFATEEPIVGIYGEIVIAAPDGPTPNDSGILANGGQNAPLLTSALGGPGKLGVRGTVDEADPTSVTVELYANPVPTPGGDPSGRGEGAVFLDTVIPNEQGAFTALLPSVPAGTLISATATDAEGNTSEFAFNVEVMYR